MKTEMISLEKEFERGIALGAELIRGGELVGFPTETVYGLGADAFQAEAVRRIFTAKGRPADNPLIVHIVKGMEERVAAAIPSAARALMDRYWPGPLTLVLPKGGDLPDVVTAGLDTVAVRMPSHPAASALIERSGTPIAAPSANLSGRPSPTAAAHVWQDMEGRIPLILDGGPCEVGLESTVLDVSEAEPVLLRPGGVTLEMLEAVIGRVQIARGALEQYEGRVKSPGMKYKHYAPRAEVVMVEGEPEAMAARICALYDGQVALGKRCVIMATEETKAFYGKRELAVCGSREKLATIAHSYFALLRELDEKKADTIYIEAVPLDELGLAIMNRALRSAGFHVEKG